MMNKREVVEAYSGVRRPYKSWKLQNIWIAYGKNIAVRDLTLTINKGDFVTILGANGAGKSSTLNAISGVVAIQRGEINYQGEKISGIRPKSVAAKGIIQIPEGRRLFPLILSGKTY